MSLNITHISAGQYVFDHIQSSVMHIYLLNYAYTCVIYEFFVKINDRQIDAHQTYQYQSLPLYGH